MFRANLLFQLCAIVLTVIMMLSFWMALYAVRTEIRGFDLQTMILYALGSVLLSIMLAQQTEHTITGRIYSGDIGMAISRPVPLPHLLFLEAVSGSAVAAVTRALPFLIAAGVVFYFSRLPVPPVSWMAVPSFVLSYVLNFLYQFIFGVVAFWTMEISGLLYAREFILLGFSGSFIPLWFFPDWLYAITPYLPFRFIYHSTLSIAVGKLSGPDACREMGLQVLWIGILLVLAAVIWKRAVRRVIVNGG